MYAMPWCDANATRCDKIDYYTAPTMHGIRLYNIMMNYADSIINNGANHSFT